MVGLLSSGFIGLKNKSFSSWSLDPGVALGFSESDNFGMLLFSFFKRNSYINIMGIYNWFKELRKLDGDSKVFDMDLIREYGDSQFEVVSNQCDKCFLDKEIKCLVVGRKSIEPFRGMIYDSNFDVKGDLKRREDFVYLIQKGNSMIIESKDNVIRYLKGM